MAKKAASELFKVTGEDLKACQKRFTFVVGKDELKREAGQVTGYFVNMANIPGFRRGKAPMNVVMRKYEKDIAEELKMRLYSQAFEKLQKEDKLDIVSCGAPTEKNPLDLNCGGDYEFSFTMEIAPEVEVGDYLSVKADVQEEEISEDAIGARVKEYGEMYGSYEEIEAKAAKEDMLKVSYTSDFELPEDASPALVRQVKAQENWIWLSEPEMIPGVIAALEGAEKGKDYEFTSTYPADYRDEPLAGKKVTYKVHVNAVQRRKALNEQELSQKMGMSSPEDLRAMLKTSLQNEANMKRRQAMADAIMEGISKNVAEFELPPNLMAGEIEKELRNMANTMVKDDSDIEEFKKNIEQHKAEAEKAAKSKLRRLFICRKIAEIEKIAVERNEVDSHIKGMSRYYGYKEKELRSMLEKNGGMEDIHLDLMVGKVIDFLVNKAKDGK